MFVVTVRIIEVIVVILGKILEIFVGAKIKMYSHFRTHLAKIASEVSIYLFLAKSTVRIHQRGMELSCVLRKTYYWNLRSTRL